MEVVVAVVPIPPWGGRGISCAVMIIQFELHHDECRWSHRNRPSPRGRRRITWVGGREPLAPSPEGRIYINTKHPMQGERGRSRTVEGRKFSRSPEMPLRISAEAYAISQGFPEMPLWKGKEEEREGEARSQRERRCIEEPTD